jgi:hypothetical protein
MNLLITQNTLVKIPKYMRHLNDMDVTHSLTHLEHTPTDF